MQLIRPLKARVPMTIQLTVDKGARQGKDKLVVCFYLIMVSVCLDPDPWRVSSNEIQEQSDWTLIRKRQVCPHPSIYAVSLQGSRKFTLSKCIPNEECYLLYTFSFLFKL